MADIALTYGTLNFLEEVEGWSEQGDSRINAQMVPRRHGLYLSDVPVLDGRFVRIAGQVVASSAQTARDRVDTIAAAINNGVQKLKFMDDRFLLAMKGRWGWDAVPGSSGRVLRLALELVCADPFLYRDTTASATRVNNGTVTATNEGTAFVYPKITFTADQSVAITSISLTNDTTGKSFTYTGTVAAGNALVVNPLDFTVKNNGVKDLTNFSGVFMWLDSGANSMTYSGSNCTILVEWRARWWC